MDAFLPGTSGAFPTGDFSYIRILLIVVVPLVIAAAIGSLIQRFIKVPKNLESPRATTYMGLAKSVFTSVIYIIAIYFILIQLHINVTPLFASAGIIGIIVGLGVRSIIEDFFTGLFILTQDTIRVGDYVEIGSAQGTTEALGFRTVRIKDQNGAIHILPNREIKKIINYSRRQARVVVDIPIKPNQKVDKALTALRQAIETIKKDKTMGPLVMEGSHVQGVEHISPGKVVIRVLLLTKAAFRWDVARTFRYFALRLLEKAGIDLA